MGLRPVFEPNGWENGFTEGHFGGEISPIFLGKIRLKRNEKQCQVRLASSDEFCKKIISGILLHRALAHSLKTRMGRGSIFFARNPARQI